MSKINNFIQLHINIVINTLSVFVNDQEPFQIMIDGRSKKYKDQFPEIAFSKEELITIDIKGWSLQKAEVSDKYALLSTEVVYGESDVHMVAIDAIDIIGIVAGPMPTLMYTKFFSSDIKPEDETPEPQGEIDTSAFEKANKEGIAKSMSCLKLLTIGEE